MNAVSPQLRFLDAPVARALSPKRAKRAVRRSYAFEEIPSTLRTLIHSMFNLMQGGLSADWVETDIEQADVVFSLPINDFLLGAGPQADGRIRIALIESGGRLDGSDFALKIPLQIMHLRRSLELVTQTLAEQPILLPRIDAARASREHWLMAESLRTVLGDNKSGQIYAAHWKDNKALWLSPAQSLYWCDDEGLERLRVGSLPISTWQPATPDNSGYESRSAQQLAWLVGLHTETKELAPWLNTTASYRIDHWPDFGLIGYDQTGLKISSRLAAEAWTAEQLAASLRIDIATTHRYLNACSLIGVLRSVSATLPGNTAENTHLSSQSSFMRSLVGAIRLRIGL
jgi:hypothetical protein